MNNKMREIFENLTNLTLDSLEMENFILIDNQEYQNYYTKESSKEHYRLLTYLSYYFNNVSFVDVGTLKGSSALALSTNTNNSVYSFNISNQLQLKKKPQNIEFIVDDVINGKYDSILLESKLILLDTFHDGSFEKKFLNYLVNLQYNGILLLDDIYLNLEMRNFWESITFEKYDATNIGHITGTGVVFFE
jgi:hypothetical protein